MYKFENSVKMLVIGDRQLTLSNSCNFIYFNRMKDP